MKPSPALRSQLANFKTFLRAKLGAHLKQVEGVRVTGDGVTIVTSLLGTPEGVQDAEDICPKVLGYSGAKLEGRVLVQGAGSAILARC